MIVVTTLTGQISKNVVRTRSTPSRTCASSSFPTTRLASDAARCVDVVQCACPSH